MEENNDLRVRLVQTEKKVEKLTGEKEGLGFELRENQEKLRLSNSSNTKLSR